MDGQGGLSPKTVTDLLVIIKKSVEYAKDHGIALSCNLRKLTIKRGRKEMRVFTQLEQEALVRVLLDELDLYKFGIMLSLYTGIRLGELCALRWEDIYIEAAMLKVRRTMQRIQDKSDKATSKTKVIITEPKSKCSIRDIPLPQFIVDLAKNFEQFPNAFVLSGDPNRYIEPRTMQNKFKKYIRFLYKGIIINHNKNRANLH